MLVSTLYLFLICSLTFLAVFHADGAHAHQKLGSTEVLREVMSRKFNQIKSFFFAGDGFYNKKWPVSNTNKKRSES